ncbi:MAG: 2-hydroxychromene-2-carboxylate isomerase [Rubrivivax sp.]|nr:2-hydroxychromene-2-carboxylate isomerase [Rubrivivax sp.]
MQRLQFLFDPVSPYAYLAFEALPQALEGCSYHVEYVPVLFAGLLQHHGQKGPAEIEPKRAWTFRQVAWRAQELGLPLQVPARHPFNPLPLLRLMLACVPAGQRPNRRIAEAVLHHVWRGGGADAEDPDRLAALGATLAPQRDPAGAEVKAELRALTEDALADGVFGVPTVIVDGRHFWGLDALPMLAALLKRDPWFDGPEWHAAGAPRPGVRRG